MTFKYRQITLLSKAWVLCIFNLTCFISVYLVPFLSIQIMIRTAVLKTSDVLKQTKNIREEKKTETEIHLSLSKKISYFTSAVKSLCKQIKLMLSTQD